MIGTSIMMTGYLSCAPVRLDRLLDTHAACTGGGHRQGSVLTTNQQAAAAAG